MYDRASLIDEPGRYKGRSMRSAASGDPPEMAARASALLARGDE
jgi:hypothetical protein